MSDLLRLKLKINGTKPSDIPMGELAGYLVDLSALYGMSKNVRFESVKEGSVEINAYTTDSQSLDVIRANILENLEGSKLAKRLNKDNYSAEIYYENELINSINPNLEDKPILLTKKNARIQGELFHIAAKNQNSASVRLKGSAGETLLCSATKADAARLGRYIFKKIRVTGTAQYEKRDGVWKLKSMKIENFSEIQDVSLSQGLKVLSEDPANKWDEIDNQDEVILKYRSFS
ncbi:hypothetical protein [Proteus mirabilis]|uniref:hypothetical protein n=1 Tax=Proteus mirabilis TaxID=584 RepID=UPI00132CDA40|nr:hypothetical protein [Proteus mirabilis]MDC5887202.1 hypothetical protein [Proteus mirabilis]MDC5888636.1 hypothetical protein [Proteus mirabilis]MDC5904799.1 hypothetical protein [Proteus mirabilis]MDC5906233.1 hypothetical protein [Proteus mirabilis]MDC5940226.1 hypothetical protein [Proteus mirabilis]